MAKENLNAVVILKIKRDTTNYSKLHGINHEASAFSPKIRISKTLFKEKSGFLRNAGTAFDKFELYKNGQKQLLFHTSKYFCENSILLLY